MSKFFKRWWQRMRRARTDAQYALLFHKVSRRLGNARARARQAELEAEYLAGEVARYRGNTVEIAREMMNELLEDQVYGATQALHRRIAALESECAVLHAECLSLRMAARSAESRQLNA